MKFTVRVKKLDKPELVAYDRIFKHYGTGCYPQTPQEKEDHWEVPVGAYFQSKIVNEKTNRERILTFNLQNVGEILVKKSTMRVERATSLRTVGKNIFKEKTKIRQTVEKDLIKVFGDPDMELRFSELKYSFTGLQPIYRTLNLLLTEHRPTFDEVLMSGAHYPEQLELIIDLGYAKYTKNNTLEPTNKLKDLFVKEKGNIERTCEIVLGLVVSTFYYDLRKQMRIAQFVPYVRASTAYYGDAIQFGKLISVSEERLQINLRDYYKRAPLPPRVRYAFPVVVNELVNARILAYDGDYITGREPLFEKLIDIRSELPIREEPFGS